MAVASTPLVAAPSCPAWAKHRRGRQPQFDGKPCEPAEEEDMWLCLADGRARSTADLKRLATAARVRAKRAGDAAAANTRDRQARDQRRRQREQHDRRAAPAVAKTVRPQRGQCGCPAHAVCGMCVDQGKLAAAEQAAIDLARARRTLRASLPSEAQRTDANGAVAPAPRAQERSRPHPQPGRPPTRVTERVTSRCATHQTRRMTVQACPRVSKSVRFGGGCSVVARKKSGEI
ncbi:hypothetical protein EMIHUDRAFT_432051 [Emiliania huxleyi CCMP1516]|uniref:Uncharacterized protein n=2 Tax=Emiliania huxleyi TaxID=2903 RepID=A0A0D3JH24_EMIH1|nr:hypothetical protein EMIHUDRAFT_432051 [Emiliania huxleyi CCMP1516]EOD22809.1 hypothetical protein EMIHUDRAFT_432051 [Emiliania huxleyi CCMP1516]|eukprot:XP_005775238.1 hypothetical protein EMIHUDRAFT_432051 [Emiliania huxleyi CCMP1516]